MTDHRTVGDGGSLMRLIVMCRPAASETGTGVVIVTPTATATEIAVETETGTGTTGEIDGVVAAGAAVARRDGPVTGTEARSVIEGMTETDAKTGVGIVTVNMNDRKTEIETRRRIATEPESESAIGTRAETEIGAMTIVRIAIATAVGTIGACRRGRIEGIGAAAAGGAEVVAKYAQDEQSAAV
jgi:tellurite resistance protein